MWLWVQNLLINSLPDGKILGWSKLKAFSDKKLNPTNTEFFSGWAENIVEKGENADSEKIFQEFLHVCKLQVVPFPRNIRAKFDPKWPSDFEGEDR